MTKIRLINFGFLFSLLLMGCQSQTQLHNNLKNFQFTCVHEKDVFPPLDPEADKWFKQAVQLSKQDNPNFNQIAQLYRQAAEKGHYKAIGNLQVMIAEGDIEPSVGKYRTDEVIELVERLIQMNIPFGYYIMGTYLDRGYGVEQDKGAAFSYMLKAAVMGNPDGQYVIGQKFIDGRTELYRLDLGRSMLACSSAQGFIKASYQLATLYKVQDNNYNLALYYYQEAVKQGDSQSVFQLYRGFQSTSINNWDYLGQKLDLERVHRYELIRKEITRNPNAKFPDIDKIVPLPPAPLPEWDGTFEYQKQAQNQ
ncbi:sel1 repeat family protein [Proteus vulgaris]|uniref:SEL1-like repeat protein n=1 Tax=Proteus vulgaris TaxID=585 RepID=UPI0021B13093|nr:sel1 repeat family protein [Proteus vulgaris]MCT6518980.1 sel1 repeat family protein [Proteus vulgaris]